MDEDEEIQVSEEDGRTEDEDAEIPGDSPMAVRRREVLLQYRRAHGMTINELAKRVGIPYVTMRGYEIGGLRPSRDRALLIEEKTGGEIRAEDLIESCSWVTPIEFARILGISKSSVYYYIKIKKIVPVMTEGGRMMIPKSGFNKALEEWGNDPLFDFQSDGEEEKTPEILPPPERAPVLSQKEIVDRLLAKTPRLKNFNAEHMVQCFFDVIREALLRGDTVTIAGFGTFKTVGKPHTLDRIPRFHPSPSLRKALSSE